MIHNGQQDIRPKDLRTLDEYFDLLACICLGQVLDDDTFKDMVMTALTEKLHTGNDQAYFLACFKDDVVRDLFSLFNLLSPVRALIVTAAV